MGGQVKNILRKGLAFVVLILFLGLTFTPSINANNDTSTASNQDNHSQKLTEDDLYEPRHGDFPMRYRYMTEDGRIHTFTKSRSELMAERTQYYDEEEQPIISLNIGDGNHTPIVIDGNDDFTSENGVTGGSGTEEDPFIIEDWVIVGNGSTSYGIWINNTDAYFVIRNCALSYFDGEFHSGIRLSNVVNGRIENCETFENYDGIYVVYSSYIDIVNCSCYDNYGWMANGIEARCSHHINISSCKCYNMYYSDPRAIPAGIDLIGTSYCLIEHCNLSNNLGVGLWASSGWIEYPNIQNTIKDCKIYNNRDYGMYLGTVFDFRYLRWGYHHISGCEIYNNGHDKDLPSIMIQYLRNNIIENCDIYHGYLGVEIAVSSHNLVRNCSIHDNSYGVDIWGWEIPLFAFAINNKIEHCDIYDNNHGIDLDETFRTIIRNNNIYNNSGGITVSNFMGISTAKIHKNNIYDNQGPYTGYGYFGLTGSISNARNNWWGSPLGPSRVLPLRGDYLKTILGICFFRPWAIQPFPDAGVQ